MMYTYLTPQDAWIGKVNLFGKPMALAYWVRWGDERSQKAETYRFRFRTLKTVEIGPHAYTLVFTDGLREELITYDTVCVYTVNLEKS